LLADGDEAGRDLVAVFAGLQDGGEFAGEHEDGQADFGAPSSPPGSSVMARVAALVSAIRQAACWATMAGQAARSSRCMASARLTGSEWRFCLPRRRIHPGVHMPQSQSSGRART
jgi:hypothetical protein